MAALFGGRPRRLGGVASGVALATDGDIAPSFGGRPRRRGAAPIVADAVEVVGVVGAMFGGRPRRRAVVGVAVVTLAPALFGGRPRRFGAAPVPAVAADEDALFGGRPRRRMVGTAFEPPDWSRRIAATSAVNSSISSRTSVSRD
jgi:hypothetical protein